MKRKTITAPSAVPTKSSSVVPVVKSGASARVRTKPRGVFYTVAGSLVEAKYEPRCHVCNSPWREEIDMAIYSGTPPVQILRTVLPENVRTDSTNEHHLDSRRIVRHADRHLPARMAITYARMRADARDRGVNILTTTDSLASDDVIMDRMKAMFYEDLIGGVVHVTPADYLRIIKLQQDREMMVDGSVSEAVVSIVFKVFMEKITPLTPMVSVAFYEMNRDPRITALGVGASVIEGIIIEATAREELVSSTLNQGEASAPTDDLPAFDESAYA